MITLVRTETLSFPLMVSLFFCTFSFFAHFPSLCLSPVLQFLPIPCHTTAPEKEKVRTVGVKVSGWDCWRSEGQSTMGAAQVETE